MHFDPHCWGEKLLPLRSVVVPFCSVMFLGRGHPRFGNFNSAIPVDVIRVKSYVNSFLDHTNVPVRVSINKYYLVPKRIMAGLVGVLRDARGLGTGESYIPVVLVDSLMHSSPCFPDDVDLRAFTRNPVNHAILFNRIDVVLRSHQIPKFRFGFEDGANALSLSAAAKRLRYSFYVVQV